MPADNQLTTNCAVARSFVVAGMAQSQARPSLCSLVAPMPQSRMMPSLNPTLYVARMRFMNAVTPGLAAGSQLSWGW